jgi:divalent metal cation (Fe/Co/Zn/Cd) transporter
MRACLVEVNKARGGRTLGQWFRESRQAELLVIFGEDLAALLGLSFALIAVLLAVFTGNPIWDAIGTVLIGLLLIVVAVFVAIEVKAMLIGQSADPSVTHDMQTYLRGRQEIARVFNLITLQLGNDLLVSVKLQMAGTGTAADLVSAINTVETDFRQRYPQVRWSFFEPDDRD